MLTTFLLASSLIILDDDTFAYRGKRIRIADIDAPETHRAQCDAERRLGFAAKGLAQLLVTGEIAVTRGDTLDGRKVDRYGRTLATISTDGRDVGEIFVADKLARPWTGERQPWCDR